MSKASFSPFPLKPIYSSYEERDRHRKIIYKLLDRNFGSVWAYYLKVKYVQSKLQHRIFVSEIHEEEKENLTESKVKQISKTRRAYCSHALELLKFYYLNGRDKTLDEIEWDTFRYRDNEGNILIQDLPPIKSLFASKEDKEPIIPADKIDMKSLPSKASSTLDVSDVVAKLEDKSKV